MKRIKKVLSLLVLALVIILALTGCTNSKSKVTGQYAPYESNYKTFTEEEKKTPTFAITKDLKKATPREDNGVKYWELDSNVQYEIIDDMLIENSKTAYYIKDNGQYIVFYLSYNQFVIYKKISNEVPANV